MKKLSLLLLMLPLLHACKKETELPPVIPPLTVTDVDGNVYRTIKIGDQIWMAENLKVTHYNDHSPIDNGNADSYDWTNNASGAYCDYDKDAVQNAKTYGHLYNWAAAVNSKKLAPAGWHIPSKAEYDVLEKTIGKNYDLIGGQFIDFTKVSSALRETGDMHWGWPFHPNEDATNISGFTALGAGARFADGTFQNIKVDGVFWASDVIEHESPSIYWINVNSVQIVNADKKAGCSIRCIKDSN
jgi:uncharacterized protein (TIGR02145 family)